MPRDDDKQTIFVASTSYALEHGWVNDALLEARARVEGGHPDVNLEPWTTAFRPGDITIHRLIELSSEVMAAVIVMTGDDQVESKGVSTQAPRDNLVFEAGMFIAQLGPEKVLLLRETDSKWPSDLSGVGAKEFSRALGKAATELTARQVGREIAEWVDHVAGPPGDGAAASLRGIRATLNRDARELRQTQMMLGSGPDLEDAVPIRNAPRAYVDAVSNVKSRFLTTTYLQSEFWTSNDIDVLSANENMLARIKSEGGTARRLILLSKPLGSELDHQRAMRRLFRKASPEEARRMNTSFRALAEVNTKLVAQGFEVKVVYDEDEVCEHLPSPIEFAADDTELALYDDGRVDVFTGFTSKRGQRVRTFAVGLYSEFAALQKAALDYFDGLWNSRHARDFATFEQDVTALIKDVDREIDYTEHWLQKYDHAIGDDALLKEGESGFVTARLSARYNGNGVRAASHVDLGTCTGRYLMQLQPFVSRGGDVIGVDNDRDCVDMLGRKQSTGAIPANIEARFGDIRYRDTLPRGQFAIVTCMMGTLCHSTATTGHRRRSETTGRLGSPTSPTCLPPTGTHSSPSGTRARAATRRASAACSASTGTRPAHCSAGRPLRPAS